jgi:hypothetical protein
MEKRGNLCSIERKRINKSDVRITDIKRKGGRGQGI